MAKREWLPGLPDRLKLEAHAVLSDAWDICCRHVGRSRSRAAIAARSLETYQRFQC